MGNRKYRTENEALTESDIFAYENPAATLTTTLVVTAGATTSNGTGVKANGALNGKKAPNIERMSSIAKVDDVESDDDEETAFGWLCYRPKWLQVLNNPVGYCTMLCLVTLIQGMTAFGFVFIALSTLEKRFFLNSVQSGSISSAYDFSTLFVAVFVSYAGERGHRPLWVGFGSMLFCAGSLIFAIPHFATPNYVYQDTDADYCGLPNQTDSCQDYDYSLSSLANYYWFFITAQILHGIGASSLYILGVTYIDENVPTKDFGMYMGTYQAVTLAGPSLGYIIGGAFLNIYTDLNVDKDSVHIGQESPLWVGAWWLGFLINCVLLFIFNVIYMGFPKALPGGKEVMAKRKFETQKGREFEAKEGALNQLRALPRAVCTLLTNIPFMCLNGAAAMAFFLVAGIAVFGPKYIESQLSMNSSEAAYAMGIITVTGGISGALIGGFLLNRLDLKFRGLLKLCVACMAFSIVACSVFFAVCPTVEFAGVTVQYNYTSETADETLDLRATCNGRCACSGSYDPVCGSDGVMYYSACYAGCDMLYLDVDNMEYHSRDDDDESDGIDDVVFSECRCIHDPSSPSGFGTISPGVCPTNCQYRWLYFAALFFIVLLGTTSGVAGWTATIRCVSHSQRAFAMGIQTLFYGLLGSVPGPIIFGALIDGSCLLWERACDGSANCWLYDNKQSARGFLVLSMGAEFLGLVFSVCALLSYRSPAADQSEEGGGDSNNATEGSRHVDDTKA